MKLTADLAARIEGSIKGLTPEPLGHINHDGIRYHALPLFGTIGEIWLLRPDGTLWRADSDSGLALEPLPEELHTVAIAAGVGRFPWLGELLPMRPATALKCPDCGGVGRIGPEEAWFCRTCSALGWVSEGQVR